MIYVYDFGDNWEHEVVLEKIIPRQKGMSYPICIDGKLACPPEDCESIPGYYHCIETIRNREDKELLEWIGDWKPDRLNPKEIVFVDPKKRFEESWD
jgi:hypothetical protein